MVWQVLLSQATRPLHLLLLASLAVSSNASVQRLSPSSGGLCGGTRISIFGSGFAKNASANRVEIGDGECKVESVSEDELVCRVPFRDAKVVTGKEKATELVSVHAEGKPLKMAKPLEFTFKAESSPLIVDWGPAMGQANDVLSFQGKDLLFGASVALGGRECKAKYSEGNYYQCVPPPREAGISSVEVDYGPKRGFACPAEKAPPLKFTYNLALQSALPDELGDDTEGPVDGGGGLTGGPCSPRAPRAGTLTVVGQGLGKSTVFKLCGGDAWCSREGDVAADPALYHGGDWSFQTLTCRPSPLDPSKVLGGSRKCDLTAEAADGMFVATLADAWTYVPATTQKPTPTTQPGADPTLEDVLPSTTPAPVYIFGAPAASHPASPTHAAISPVPGPAPAPAFRAAPTPALPVWVNPAVPAPTSEPGHKARRALQKMAREVLSKAFKSVADALTPDSSTLLKEKTPPAFPVSRTAYKEAPQPRPPPLEPVPLPNGLLEAAPPALAPAPGTARQVAFLHGREAEGRVLRSALRLV